MANGTSAAKPPAPPERDPMPQKLSKKTTDLIAKWQAIVESVEKGYGFGLFDYRNDLDIRSQIGAKADVAALDARFQACLTARKIKIWESDVKDAFWCYGYPKKTNREFKQDLKAEGLL
jgi:hypothetical protein